MFNTVIGTKGDDFVSLSTQVLPDTTKMTYNQISKSCELFVYPANGQTQQQQKG